MMYEDDQTEGNRIISGKGIGEDISCIIGKGIDPFMEEAFDQHLYQGRNITKDAEKKHEFELHLASMRMVYEQYNPTLTLVIQPDKQCKMCEGMNYHPDIDICFGCWLDSDDDEGMVGKELYEPCVQDHEDKDETHDSEEELEKTLRKMCRGCGMKGCKCAIK